MTFAFLLQFAGSLLAVALLVALAAWAKVARAAPALDEASARVRLEEEFPEHELGPVWVAADGRSALARSGDQALLLAAVGDGWVSRTTPWSAMERGRRKGDQVVITTGDLSAPAILIGAEVWPPVLEAA